MKDSLGELKSGDWKKAGKFAGVASAGALAAGFASEINMQQAVNRTSAQLGLTKEEAAKVGAASGQLYRDGLGSSMEEVSAATGSVIGAYIIQALTITLYAMKVSSTAVKAYKAIVIIAIVVLGSPVVKKYALMLRDKIFTKPMKVTEM